MKPTQIIVTITSFVDNATTAGFCQASLAYFGNNPNTHITIETVGTKQFIKFAKKPGPLQLMIAGPGDTYYALGVAFMQTKFDSTTQDTHGEDNFDLPKIDRATASVTFDNKFTKALKSGVKYETFIFVQRRSDGAMGVIDPDILNEN